MKLSLTHAMVSRGYRRSAPRNLLAAAICVFYPLQAAAQMNDQKTPPRSKHEHQLEEVLVTAQGERSRRDLSQATTVLSGDALAAASAATLGDTLQKTPGMSSASFGPGVGSPVIRGQSGNRVKVLNNGAGVADASALSPDHANAVEPLLAERIEVIRGPSTLLYGNGAIGGVVNVIDNRIPSRRAETTQGAIEQRHDTNADQNTTVAKIDTGHGDWALHVDGVYRDRNDVRIDGEAISAALHDEAAEAEEEAHAHGYIPNTGALSKSLSIGNSWVTDAGYAGLAVSRLENRYGIPPGAHHHDEDETDEEHEEAAEGEESLLIDMNQTRVDARSGWSLSHDVWKQLDVLLGYSDYEHSEIEGGAVGTRFTNEALEARVTATHRFTSSWSGVVGYQGSTRDFAALGDEAFIPQTDGKSSGLFTVQTYKHGAWTYDAGLRVEHTRLSPRGDCEQDDTSLSASLGAVWRFDASRDMLLSLSQSQRAPSIEEYFSNVETGTCTARGDDEERIAHVASQRIEIGSPALDRETASNIEWGLRQVRGRLTGSVSVFYNDIHDFIYLADTGVFVDDTQVSHYRQQAAVFRGAEFELLWHSSVENVAHWEASLFGDVVDAEFDNGNAVPRTPPWRAGIELALIRALWSVRLRWTEVAEQEEVAASEPPTDGYSLVTLYTDVHLPVGDGSELTLFLRGNNLLDEEIRQHASFIKDIAPEPGRGVEAGIRFVF